MPRVDQIKKLLQTDPGDVFLNFSLAMEYKSVGQAEEALRQFDKTLALDAKYLAAYVRKGEVLLSQRRFDEARRTLEEGARIARETGDQHGFDHITQMLDLLP